MKHHLSQNSPFATTKVPYGATKNDIEEMLKEAGALAMRWTETPDSMKGVALPVLEFIIENQVIGDRGEVISSEKIPIRIQAPLTSVTKMRRTGPYSHARVHEPNRNGSMRLLYWYLKSRLEAARFGLEDLSTTFMAKRILTLPDPATGKPISTTFGEAVKERPEVFRGMLPSFKLDTDNALEDNSS